MSNVLVKIAMLLLVVAFPLGAMAQHNHAAGHDAYSKWKNLEDFMCCNNNDCGALDEVQERMVNGRTEVFVGFGTEKKEWCPVDEKKHSLKGKFTSPDYSASHACVLPPTWAGSVCERFKCYMPRPLS